MYKNLDPNTDLAVDLLPYLRVDMYVSVVAYVHAGGDL